MRSLLLLLTAASCGGVPQGLAPHEAILRIQDSLRRGRFDDAAQVREQALWRYPRNAELLIWSSTLSLMDWKFDRALVELQRVDRTFGRGGLSGGECAGRIGEVMFTLGRYGQAVPYLEEGASGDQGSHRQALAVLARHLPSFRERTAGAATEVPLLPGSLPRVVCVSGERSRVFVLDTGSTMTVLSRSLAAELEVSPVLPAGTIHDGAGRSFEAGIGVIRTFSLGEVRLGASPVLVVDDRRLALRDVYGSPEHPPSAVVGLDVLSRFRLTLDPDRRSLIIEPPRGLREGSSVRCLWSPDGGCLVPVTIEGDSYWFKLDTGASHSSLTPEGLARIPDGTRRAVSSARRFRTVGGTTMSVQELRNVVLRCGTVRFRGVTLPVVPRATSGLFPVHGVLGADLLLRCRLTLDRGRVRLAAVGK